MSDVFYEIPRTNQACPESKLVRSQVKLGWVKKWIFSFIRDFYGKINNLSFFYEQYNELFLNCIFGFYMIFLYVFKAESRIFGKMISTDLSHFVICQRQTWDIRCKFYVFLSPFAILVFCKSVTQLTPVTLFQFKNYLYVLKIKWWKGTM